MFGGLSHDCELPRSEVPSDSLWVPQSIQPGPSWRCLPLTARTDHIIYDHHPSFLRQPIPQEVLESFFSLNDLFFFFFFYCLSPRVVEILYHLWNPIKILFPYFPFMMTGISFRRRGPQEVGMPWRESGPGEGALLSDSTGIESWQHPLWSCGPFSAEGFLCGASFGLGDTAMGL